MECTQIETTTVPSKPNEQRKRGKPKSNEPTHEPQHNTNQFSWRSPALAGEKLTGTQNQTLIMAAIWGKVKKGALRTKLQAEVAFLQRETNGRKKAFGVELYNLLTNDKNKLLGVTAGTILKGHQAEIKDPFERARDDIMGIQARKDVKQKDLDVMEVKGAHTMPDSTVNEKVSKAGKTITNAGAGAKLKAEMALLDREMKIRKEQFGMEVFDLVSASDESKQSGIKGAVSGALSNLSQQEKDIQACIDRAKMDVASIEGRKKSKETEVGLINDELQSLKS